MAKTQTVTYAIRLKDLMSKSLRRMSSRVRAFAKTVKTSLVKALAMARKALRLFTVGVGAATAAMGVIGFAAIRMGKTFLDAASNLEDTQAKFRVVFQGIEDDAMSMVEQISEGLKLGQGSVMGFMATFQDTLVPLGFARDEAAQMSGALTQLAADMRAFNTQVHTTEEAISILQSVMVGMYRPALRVGVAIDKNKVAAEALALGLVDANGELSEQNEILAALSLTLKGTIDAHGAFLRMEDSLTVQTVQFTEAVTDIREEMGARLKKVLQDTVNDMGGVEVVIDLVRVGFEMVTSVLTEMVIPAVRTVLENFAKFVEGLGGADEGVRFFHDTVVAFSKAFVTGLSAAALITMLFVQGLSTLIAMAKNAGLGLAALASGIGLGLMRAIELLAEQVLRLAEIFPEAWRTISEAVRTAISGSVGFISDFIYGFSQLITLLAAVPGAPDFLFELGVDAAEAARKVDDLSFAIAEIPDPDDKLANMFEQVRRIAGDAAVDLQLVLFEISDTMEGITSEFVDDVSGRVPTIQALFDAMKNSASGLGADFDGLAARATAAAEAMKTVTFSTPEEEDKAKRMRESLERIAELYAVMGDRAAQASGGIGLAADEMEKFAEFSDKAEDAVEGISGGLEFFVSRLPTMQEALADITVNGINRFADGLTDAFVSIIDGSEKSSVAFRKFAAQFLIDIGRMIIQMLIFQAISASLGYFGIGGGGNTMLGGGGLAKGGTITGGTGELVPLAKGGIVQGGLGRALPMKGYANGGPIVDKPHIALIGEGKHNEAVVPLPDGRSIPVDMQGEGGANVTVQINAVDAKSVDLLFRERKDTLIDVIRQAISQSRSFRSAVGGA